MSEPFKLFRLQQIDTQLDQHRARLAEINTILANATEIQTIEAELSDINSTLAANQKLLNQAEDQVNAQRIKIEQTEASLYGGKVRNPKELQDLQLEAAALKRHLAILEDRQFDAMMAVEESGEKKKETSLHLERAVTNKQQQDHGLEQEKSILLQEIERTESERNAAALSIPEADLAIYNHLRVQRRGVAVARVKDRTCSACGGTLSAAQFHIVRSPTQITRCDHCSRILYSG